MLGRKVIMLAGALVLVMVVIFLVAYLNGCTYSYSGRSKVAFETKSKRRMAHGGTTPPNAAAYDAMFFKHYGVNPEIQTDDDHLSTFAIDVDTASYTICRKYLKDKNVPPNEAVRVEEFVNYFDYDYKMDKDRKFTIHIEGAPTPFGKRRHLLRIGLKGMEISAENRKPAVLTFVIDVSSSMSWGNRIELVKKSLRYLVKQLGPQDLIGIAVYGSRGREYLDHKSVESKEAVIDAIDDLECGGSTFAEEGIRKGYQMAERNFRRGYINRVILCSDGVANVGKTGFKEILEVIKRHVKKGITLTTVGFGMGNYNDVLMEQLGDKGNGHYAYIDTFEEAKRIFGEKLTSTLQVIAKDVKVQVDFDQKVVRSYRLLGYENRRIKDKEFRKDYVDGGEVGAGHSVTALYEIKLNKGKKGRIATVYLRYKDVDKGDKVVEINRKIFTSDLNSSFNNSSSSYRLAAVAAEFAEILRKSYWAQEGNIKAVLEIASTLPGEFDNRKDIVEFVDLVKRAKELKLKPKKYTTTSGKYRSECK